MRLLIAILSRVVYVVCLSVRLSVRLSVTLMCPYVVNLSSRSSNSIALVSSHKHRKDISPGVTLVGSFQYKRDVKNRDFLTNI